jgi:hypothetical protein
MFNKAFSKLKMDLGWDLPGPCQPIKFEGLTPVYSSRQVEEFGDPDEWGICVYQVVEVREDVEYVSSWKDQIMRAVRPIHRYCRVKRFETTLYQLLGLRGNVPDELIYEIKILGYDERPDSIWESIRDCLKEIKEVEVLKKFPVTYQTRIYYNRIPTIMRKLGHCNLKIDFGDLNSFLLAVVDEFRRVSWKFDKLSCEYKYFPNMRFICLKMLQHFGAGINYFIPIIRTRRKYKPLDELWEKLIK